jgi:hypothetical protein
MTSWKNLMATLGVAALAVLAYQAPHPLLPA